VNTYESDLQINANEPASRFAGAFTGAARTIVF
jgi:hypothetical protein